MAFFSLSVPENLGRRDAPEYIEIESSSDSWLTDKIFTAASLCTDPICFAQRDYVMIKVAGKYGKSKRCCMSKAQLFYLTRMLLRLPIAVLGAPMGIGLRVLGNKMRKQPFCFTVTSAPEVAIKKGELNHIFWNCCGFDGFAITDGGVIPWHQGRSTRIIEKIRSLNANIVSLCEIVDDKLAMALIHALKDRYKYFAHRIGPRAVGPSSGLFVASNVKISNPQFWPFPKEILSGRSKGQEKGVFKIDVENGEETFSIFVTHMSHSELPEHTTKEERIARAQQMAFILKIMDDNPYPCILTGDWNMPFNEFEKEHMVNFHPDDGDKFNNEPTWDGDRWCAKLDRKKVSGKLKLDYFLVARDLFERKKDIRLAVTSEIIDVQYNPNVYSSKALSDHKIVNGKITFKC